MVTASHTHKTPRIQSIEERSKREFHAKVRKIKDFCTENNIDLFTFEEADIDYICIASNNDYELGGITRSECCSENENYFVTESDYSNYMQDFNSFID